MQLIVYQFYPVQSILTNFLSEGFIFAYPLPHHRINENQVWHGEKSIIFHNTIAINVMYIDNVEDNAYSL